MLQAGSSQGLARQQSSLTPASPTYSILPAGVAALFGSSAKVGIGHLSDIMFERTLHCSSAQRECIVVLHREDAVVVMHAVCYPHMCCACARQCETLACMSCLHSRPFKTGRKHAACSWVMQRCCLEYGPGSVMQWPVQRCSASAPGW